MKNCFDLDEKVDWAPFTSVIVVFNVWWKEILLASKIQRVGEEEEEEDEDEDENGTLSDVDGGRKHNFAGETEGIYHIHVWWSLGPLVTDDTHLTGAIPLALPFGAVGNFS